jgi:hypothetical protein
MFQQFITCRLLIASGLLLITASSVAKYTSTSHHSSAFSGSTSAQFALWGHANKPNHRAQIKTLKTVVSRQFFY